MRLVALLALLPLLLAGCAVKHYAPATSETPGPTGATPWPNFAGNWTTIEGTYELYSTRAVVEYLDEGEWKPVTPQCARPQLPFYWDATNDTLYLHAEIAVHPHDPGPLTGVWIQEQVFGPQCNLGGFFGVNEKWMNRSLPLLPSPADYNGTFLFLNVSYERISESPPRHSVTVGNETFTDRASGDSATFARDAQGRQFRSSVRLEFVGEFPYASIRRYA